MTAVADLTRASRTLEALAAMTAAPLKKAELQNLTRSTGDLAKYVLADHPQAADVTKLLSEIASVEHLARKGRHFDATQYSDALHDAAAKVDDLSRSLQHPQALTPPQPTISAEAQIALDAEIEAMTASTRDPLVLNDGALAQGILRRGLQKVGVQHLGIHVHGAENVPLEGRLIIAPPHGAYLDAVYAIGGVERHARFMGMLELWEKGGGVIGKLGSKVGAFPIDRTNGSKGLSVARGALAKDDALVMFMEGRMVRGNHLGEPRNGAAELALQMHSPVLPLGMFGNKPSYTRRLMERVIPQLDRIFPSVDVVYGKPIDFGNLPATAENIEYARETIWRAVDELTHVAQGKYEARMAKAAARRPYVIAGGTAATTGAVLGVRELRS